MERTMRRQREPLQVQLDSLRGPVALVVLTVAPVVLWARVAPLDTRFATTYTTLTSIAVMLALAGTASFALNLVLGARLRPVERLFGGLDRMYAAHRTNGKVAFSLLLGHVVLILWSRATISFDTAVDLLGPAAGATVFVGVLAFSAMTVSILLTLFVRLGHEVFVYVQRSFGLVFLAATYHVFTTDGALAASGALELYLVTLATLGIAAFVYRSLLSSVLVRRRRYRVVDVNRLNECVTEIVMEPVRKPMDFAPGQFVFVNFRSPELDGHLQPFELSLERQVLSVRPGEIANQFHPFSITSAPEDPRLRVTVKAVGDYTRALRKLESGADAVVEGPYGAFSHTTIDNSTQVWIAGGIGVTPFLSMARSLADGEGPAVDFYYCVEHEEEAHFLEELRAVERRRPDFRLVLVPRDREGFLTADRLGEEHKTLTSADVLVCGPPAMLASMRTQLRASGVPGRQIHMEEFGFARRAPSDPAPATSAGRQAESRLSDGQLLALLAGFVFVGLAAAAAVIAESALAAGSVPR
jgi:predicted ferric reductase